MEMFNGEDTDGMQIDHILQPRQKQQNSKT